METTTERVNDVVVITIAGDLNAAAQEQLDATYAAAITDDTCKIVVVFHSEDHINSAGIGGLIGLVMECRNSGRAVHFVHPAEHFRKIFDIVGLSRYAPVFSTLDEALGHFA
jgi:anti-anti-sigma factor